MRRIFEFSHSPPFWVVQDDDGYWLMPARDGGWDAREPFFGRVGELRELAGPGAIDPGFPPANP